MKWSQIEIEWSAMTQRVRRDWAPADPCDASAAQPRDLADEAAQSLGQELPPVAHGVM